MKKLICTLLIAAFTLGLSAAAFADTNIKVSGSGQVQLAPDHALLSLGVSIQDKDASQAMSTVNQRLESIRAALKENGVEAQDIAIGSIYLYPQYEYGDFGHEETISGYSVSHQLNVTVRDVNKLGQVIDAAILAGANQMGGIEFRSTQYDEAYLQALTLATENARTQALALASAAGLTLGSIEEISSDGSSWSGSSTTALLAKGSASDTTIDVGSLNVNASVTISFEAE